MINQYLSQNQIFNGKDMKQKNEITEKDNKDEIKQKEYQQLSEDINKIQKMILLEENDHKKDLLEQTYKHITFHQKLLFSL